MRPWFSFWFTASLCLFVFASPFEANAQASNPSPIQRYALSNGLRVVLESLPERATTGVCVTYLAGSGLEQEGQSGIALLVERLMSQGSRNVGPNDHARLLNERGADSHSLTTEEYVSYCTDVIPTELPLVFWLEADRMGQLALNKDSFERQRALAFEEHRLVFSRDAYARGLTRLHELVFQRHWPYEHPALGFRQDLLTAEYTQVKAFVSDYYSPENAVVSVVGAFDEANVKALLDEYFSGLPKTARRPQSPKTEVATLARQTSERLSVLEDRSLTAPVVFYGWRIPAARTRESRALALAAHILGNSQTGRLQTDMLDNETLAREIECSTHNLHDAGIFRVRVSLHRRSTVDAMQKALEKQLLSLKLSGPTPSELERAKAALGSARSGIERQVLTRSRELGRLEAVFGDPTSLDSENEAFASITTSDVRAAVAKHLLDTRRSIVELYPHGWVRDIGPPVITKTYIVQPGDNLTRIATRYGTTPEQLAKQNGLALSKRITVGQRLLITTNPAKIVKPITHTVAKGQTLIAIGKKFGVSAEAIAKANGLTTKKAIRPGQVLQIPAKPKVSPDPKTPQPPAANNPTLKPPPGTGKEPPKTDVKPAAGAKNSPPPQGKPSATASKGTQTGSSSKPASATPASPNAAKPPPRTYVVKPGDSLSVIAQKFKVSVPALTRANGISRKKPIRPGQKLVIP